MNATPPEAMAEYSKGSAHRRSGDPATAPTIPALVAVAAVLGALLLLVAEFTTLFEITSASRRLPIQTTGTGSHHSYALIPIALLVAFLAYGVAWTGGRPALWAIGALGVVALLIALVGDLPDAQADGVYGSTATGLIIASASPDAGLYMETLGAVLLIVAAGTGLILGGPGAQRHRAGRRSSPDAPPAS
jgi:hypothetical protein